MIFSSSVCLEHSTVKAYMARGVGVYPPSIRSTNHIYFIYHGGVRLLLIFQVSPSRSVRYVPARACHMTWLSAILTIEKLNRSILWWLVILGLLEVSILIMIAILIRRAVLIIKLFAFRLQNNTYKKIYCCFLKQETPLL